MLELREGVVPKPRVLAQSHPAWHPFQENTEIPTVSQTQQVPVSRPRSDNQFYKAIPLMNKDSKYFTPSFILHSEQKFYQENDEKMLSIHLEKVESMQPDLTCPIVTPFHSP